MIGIRQPPLPRIAIDQSDPHIKTCPIPLYSHLQLLATPCRPQEYYSKTSSACTKLQKHLIFHDRTKEFGTSQKAALTCSICEIGTLPQETALVLVADPRLSILSHNSTTRYNFRKGKRVASSHAQDQHAQATDRNRIAEHAIGSSLAVKTSLLLDRNYPTYEVESHTISMQWSAIIPHRKIQHPK